jgi:hypothetical protein
MQNFYLIDYIKENFNIEKSILESIKYELDQHIYYYGRQFKYPRELLYDLTEIKKEIINALKQYITLISCVVSPNLHNGKKNVLSNAYFSTSVELTKLNFNVYGPPWDIRRDLKVLVNREILRGIEYFKNSFRKKTFADLIRQELVNRIHIFISALEKYFLDYEIAALFVPNDIGFFESLSIKVCRRINRPSFIFLHGLPGRYNNIDDNKTDYLIVWGERIKNNYINAGIDGKKIFVSGHPYYKELKWADLKFNLDSPLIITKSMNGGQCNDGVRLTDRGNLVLYLYMVQSVLRKFGVKRVRFRPHPSENSEWYFRFIDKDFYQVDQENLQKSLQKSTIVIGPTSTIFLETLYNGVNYVCFEPSWNDMDLTNFELVPPFDGSDERLPVAKNEEQLEYIIKEETKVDMSIFNEYIKTPFDLSFVKSMI